MVITQIFICGLEKELAFPITSNNAHYKRFATTLADLSDNNVLIIDLHNYSKTVCSAVPFKSYIQRSNIVYHITGIAYAYKR